MRKIAAELMVAIALMSSGCSGRNADFGIVDMRQVEESAAVVKTTREEVTKKLQDLEAEMRSAMEGKDEEEQKKAFEEYSAKANLIQSEAQNKLKVSLETGLAQVAKEKDLGAILIKEAVPHGGKDVTQDLIDKMK
ncbi:MAG: OmpH family outer membrane protein [Phascolarctobacterium sp.]|nr:OmpH family outer membrane protein [Phascolarctobacterium sp.]